MLKWLPRVALSLMLALAPLSPLLATASYSAIGGNTTLAVTGSSSSTILPGDPGQFPAVQIINDGTNEAFVAIGGSSVTASTSSAPNANNLPIPAGGWLVVYADATHNYVAGIGSGSTTLRILQWNGLPSVGVLTAAASTGGGGSVTQGTTPWVDNITQWASGVLAAMANYGTAPTGLVPGVNAYVTNTPSVNQGTSPWISNVSQFGGVNISTGTGASGTGIPRVTISNDSSLAANQSVNTNQWAGVGLGAPSNYGTSPGAVAVLGVNAFVTNAPDIPSAAAPTVSASGAVTSLVLKASATISLGGVKYFHAENGTATAGYCILYNGTAAPGTGALTAGNVLAFQQLPASSYCDWTATNIPIAASTGAVVLLSSAATPFTYTTGTITGSIYGLAQ